MGHAVTPLRCPGKVAEKERTDGKLRRSVRAEGRERGQAMQSTGIWDRMTAASVQALPGMGLTWWGLPFLSIYM